MMAEPKWTDFGLDPENDDAAAVKEKLGMKSEEAESGDKLLYLNSYLDHEKNTLLMRFVKQGKWEAVECLLKFKGLEVNAQNEKGVTAAKIAMENSDYICLLMLLEADSLFPKNFDPGSIDENKSRGKKLVEFLERTKKLHEYIKSDNLESDVLKVVMDVTKLLKTSLYLDLKNKSLLYYAAKKGRLEVFSYLLFIGARFKDIEESGKYQLLDFQKYDLEVLMEEYFTKDEESHLLKLMASSKSIGSYTNAKKKTVEEMFNYLNRIKSVSLLMKVVAHQEVDFVFDFESEFTDRIRHRERGEIYGLTDPKIHRIFIGARTCRNSQEKDVAGTVAHEMCHIVMQVLYDNKAKPYENDDGEKEKEFGEIVQDVAAKKDLHDVIHRVFDYNKGSWHPELIVRVPHILAIYGNIEGRKILHKQVPGLYKFYEANVTPACKNYCENAFFTKPICMIQSLQKYHGCIQETERGMHPLNESKSFKDYLNSFENISVLVTSNTKLCSLHVYHELKGEYHYLVEKQCLFFTLEIFNENLGKILNAFRCKACHYIVLVAKNEMLDFNKISKHFNGILCKEKKAILIIPKECVLLDADWGENLLDYDWNEFSDKFKEFLMEKKVYFKGMRSKLKYHISLAELSKIIAPEDLLQLTDQESLKIGDGKHLTYHRYNKNYFIDRSFVKVTVKKSIFMKTFDLCALLVTGLKKEKLQELGIDKGKIQLIGDLDKEVKEERYIFLPLDDTEASKIFDTCFHSKHSVNWLHYLNGEFHLRRTRGNNEVLKGHLKKEFLTEKELINVSKNKVVLISGDAGTGKSTVISDLIGHIKETFPDEWVWRLDLNMFACHEKNPLSLANIKAESDTNEVIDVFLKMLGLKTSLELYLLKKHMKSCVEKYHVFIDGYDEICPKYRQNVLKLLRVLKAERAVKIWITTRGHERMDLEMELDTFSYNMELFTDEEQARYLDMFWKHNLKFQNAENTEQVKERAIEMIGKKIGEMEQSMEGQYDSNLRDSFNDLKGIIGDSKETPHEKLVRLKSVIDKIDFTKYAMKFLAAVRDSIHSEDIQFTGLPLNLYILGSVAYNKSLRVSMDTNIHSLYSDFVKTKVDIYWKEKCKIPEATVGGGYLYDKYKEETMNIHKEIAKCEVLLEKWDNIHENQIMKNILDLGMVIKGDSCFHFIDRTTADFFFSEWVAEKISSGFLEEELLKVIMTQPKYIGVRKFLKAIFQNMEENVICDRMIQELHAKGNFCEDHNIQMPGK